MGYANQVDPDGHEPSPGFAGHVNNGLTILVRLLGITILVVGALAAAKVLLEGWALYETPERIESLAAAIERGSNLDALFETVAPAAPAPAPLAEGEEPVIAAPAPAPQPLAGANLRLSYFAAWFVALMLLLVLGMIAMSAISTGGQLALRELPVRRISRDVVREVRRLQRAA